MTHKQLALEVEDEILAHRGACFDEHPVQVVTFLLILGRVNVVEIQPALNVDLTFIEEKVRDLVQRSDELVLLNGEVVAECANLISPPFPLPPRLLFPLFAVTDAESRNTC